MGLTYKLGVKSKKPSFEVQGARFLNLLSTM